ncbi:MAG: hypothetical protein H0U05_12125 [Actinobacteria bacterium]|nr:hypothetical protein [Actinomycetota bacterium]
MIRLRSIVERGCSHPILGPIVLLFLVLVLSMVFLHAAEEGLHAAMEAGAVCFGFAAFLGLVLLDPARLRPPAIWLTPQRERGPPAPTRARYEFRLPVSSTALPSIPLRR